MCVHDCTFHVLVVIVVCVVLFVNSKTVVRQVVLVFIVTVDYVAVGLVRSVIAAIVIFCTWCLSCLLFYLLFYLLFLLLFTI